METPTPIKTKMTNKPSRNNNVRVVAKVKGLADLDTGTVNWLSVHKAGGEESDAVTVSLIDELTSSRKESYKLDYYYDQTEGNEKVFEREVKPLIEGVFDGLNATVVAYGARGSGKSHMIQGSDKEPGLATLAVSEILSRAEAIGRTISVSVYDICQDHVYDFLDSKRPEVFILEDSQGRIQLKGLSQVTVNSVSEFEKLFIVGDTLCKPGQKTGSDSVGRNHRGIIVHLSSASKPIASKMNFVDLAGYEDARRKSTEGSLLVESNKVTKSMYALLNVVYALKACENHVPYRESKLTRMLKDSLGRNSKIVMLTCLNPSVCQDSMYMLSLASRCCQGICRAFSETARKPKSSASPMVVSLQRSQLTGSISTSRKPRTLFPVRKVNRASEMKERRKLFDEASHLTKSEKTKEKVKPCPENASAIEPSVQHKADTTSDIAQAIESSVQPEVNPSSDSDSSIKPSVQQESPSTLEVIAPKETVVLYKEQPEENSGAENSCGEMTPAVNNSSQELSMTEESLNMDKENCKLLIDDDHISPPISSRVEKVNESLKSLMSFSLTSKLPSNSDYKVQALTEVEEPKTPTWSMCEIGDRASPLGRFTDCKTEMKKTYVHNYLQVLNTGSKEQLKSLKGIGEKRANSIIKLREESPEPFKNLDDLKALKLSAKQITKMMKMGVGDIFN